MYSSLLSVLLVFSSSHVCCLLSIDVVSLLLAVLLHLKQGEIISFFFFLLLIPLNTWQVALRDHYYHFWFCPLPWSWTPVHKRLTHFRRDCHPWGNLGIANHPQVWCFFPSRWKPNRETGFQTYQISPAKGKMLWAWLVIYIEVLRALPSMKPVFP